MRTARSWPAFTETDLRSAHVVARRIASVLKHTMLSPDLDREAIRPTVTLATLKPSDNLSTLVARVGTYPEGAYPRLRPADRGTNVRSRFPWRDRPCPQRSPST